MINRRAMVLQSGGAMMASAMGLPRSFASADASPGLAPTPASANLIVHRTSPLNAEPRGPVLGAGFITAQRDFYVRNHGAIPQLDAADYRLRIDGIDVTPTLLSLQALRTRFAWRSVKAVLQCAGNRRADFAKVKSVEGDPWQAGAISNALWSGVRLADVLRAAGITALPGRHVAFTGHDIMEQGGERFHYGVSIPLGKALADETLLAMAMNGRPLSPEHGFPLRIITPGYAGARSPKWLASITVQDRPSDNYVQQKLYKLLPPAMTRATDDPSQGLTINAMPLNSAILEPVEGDALKRGRNRVRGYAIASGIPIVRVEVSADGGVTWQDATIERHPDARWSWVLWSAQMTLQRGSAQLVVRAFDAAGGTQPANAAEIYNFRGYLCRAWHRVTVEVV